MRTVRARLRSQAGQSVAEFAIVAPIMVMIVLYATFFTDAFKVKLKNQEAAIFASWEFASLPLSDYNQNKHDPLYQQAKQRILADVNDKYQFFDSSNPASSNPTIQDKTFISVKAFKIADSDFTNDPVPIVSTQGAKSVPGIGGLLGSLGGVANNGINAVVGMWGFDKNGMMTVKTHSTYQNVILPSGFLDTHFHAPMVKQLANFQLDDSASVVMDPWTVNDGRDVDLKTTSEDGEVMGSIGGNTHEHPFARQVGQMSFLGLRSKIGGVTSKVSRFAQFLGLGDPLANPVVSLNYTHGDINPPGMAPSEPDTVGATKHGMVSYKNVENRDSDHGIKLFHTEPFRDHISYANSLNAQVFAGNGPYYMGCPTDQAPDPTKCH
ncbi:MAG: pilus assembly protein [Deltaproteobacteria bacterium]|nr:pilus assembly protein [Deltaproteobacteria bacterium]